MYICILMIFFWIIDYFVFVHPSKKEMLFFSLNFRVPSLFSLNAEIITILFSLILATITTPSFIVEVSFALAFLDDAVMWYLAAVMRCLLAVMWFLAAVMWCWAEEKRGKIFFFYFGKDLQSCPHCPQNSP